MSCSLSLSLSSCLSAFLLISSVLCPTLLSTHLFCYGLSSLLLVTCLSWSLSLSLLNCLFSFPLVSSSLRKQIMTSGGRQGLLVNIWNNLSVYFSLGLLQSLLVSPTLSWSLPLSFHLSSSVITSLCNFLMSSHLFCHGFNCLGLNSLVLVACLSWSLSLSLLNYLFSFPLVSSPLRKQIMTSGGSQGLLVNIWDNLSVYFSIDFHRLVFFTKDLDPRYEGCL